jgi:hypothetical protein
VTGFCEHSNQLMGSTQCGKLLHLLRIVLHGGSSLFRSLFGDSVFLQSLQHYKRLK